MTPNPDSTMPYAGPVDCAMQTLKKEVSGRGRAARLHVLQLRGCCSCGAAAAAAVHHVVGQHMALACEADAACAHCPQLTWLIRRLCTDQPPLPAPLLQGPLKFYTGFPTYFIRIAPHVVFTLVFMDALPKVQKQFGL